MGNGECTGNGPFSLEQFSTANVAAIDCNDNHTWVLNKSGELYGVGSGSQTGISASNTKIFSKVSSKDKVKIIGCGSNFSIFCTENNELFGVGCNTDGRLGLLYNNGTAVPQKIELSSGKMVKQISCGSSHSLILTSEGTVYATGSNEHGQLGICDENGNKLGNVNSFRIVPDLTKKKTVYVCAGANFSIVNVYDKVL